MKRVSRQIGVPFIPGAQFREEDEEHERNLDELPGISSSNDTLFDALWNFMKKSPESSGKSLQKLTNNRSQLSGLRMLMNGFDWAKISFADKVYSISSMMQKMKFKIVSSTEY